MTKWKHVIKWFLKSLILHYGCSAYNINSEVCLEKLLHFALGDEGCKFTLTDAKKWLEAADSSFCPKKCRVKINNLEESQGIFKTKYRLKFIDLSINELIEDIMTIERKCSLLDSLKDERTMEINCKTNLEKLNSSKSLCSSNQNCTEESKKCSLTGNIGICKCRPGYIGLENKCLKGNLKLNDTCQRNEQCSMVSGLICQNDTCVRRRGYVPLNDSECFPSTSGGIFQKNFKEQEKDVAVSVIVVSVLGGLILGIVLTVVIGNMYHHLRYGKFKTKEYSRTAVFNNATYETETGVLQNNPTEHLSNERQILNVPPFAHSDESQKNRNVQEDIKSSIMENNDVNNDVYNHLNEKEEENPDVDETYDHAHGTINLTMEESDYSNLNTGRRHMASDVSVSEDNDYNVKQSASDYFSLTNK
ncbi:uncharacterized protein LOC134260413 isoform X1 [Saccostrea cucullata]|uniref:uncharacterized protein LOC134260413 isoform X1 n=1 Tax=Saccostrea cuccullata TaxID=36930 RepID=UPI002ED3D413